MSEDYIEYWGLKQHPFLLAPDSGMMHKAGQYYECLERLKYAINTNKGGALLVSEDAGLGKTTVLLKLIEEMRAQHGRAFKYAFVSHPTLTPNQLIAYIAGCFADATPNDKGLPSNFDLDFSQNKRQVTADSSMGDDKLGSLMRLKESLVETKRQGGKNIIIVDEGQMLCGARDIMQELRVLINLTYENEYLHTFIFSGQKPLWNEVKAIPELWQRLPVRYYLVPLHLEETRDLIKHRLMKAGLGPEREIFTGEAFEIIQRYSMGSPRTIIAVADLALLIGYTDRSAKIGFKELTKAINAMAGKGESLAYVREEKETRGPEEPPVVMRDKREEAMEERAVSSVHVKPKLEINKTASVIMSDIKEGPRAGTPKRQVTPRLVVLVILLVVIGLSALGYHFISSRTKTAKTAPAKEEVALVVAGAEKISAEESGKADQMKQGETARSTDTENPSKAAQVEGTGMASNERIALQPRAAERPIGEAQQPKVQTMRQVETWKKGDIGRPERESQLQTGQRVKQEETIQPRAVEKVDREGPQRKAGPIKQEGTVQNGTAGKPEKQVVVISATGANIRSEPDIRSPRIGLFMEGEQFKVIDERKDAEGQTWYKFYLHGNRVGWVSERTVEVR